MNRMRDFEATTLTEILRGERRPTALYSPPRPASYSIIGAPFSVYAAVDPAVSRERWIQQ